MAEKTLKDVVANDTLSIREVMALIDRSGLRIAFIVDKSRKLLGAVSDSEIRKAILGGHDIKGAVGSIVNPNPIVLRPPDAADSSAARTVVHSLIEKMPDSRYILALDAKDRPKRLVPIHEVAGGKAREHALRRVLVVGGAGYLGSILSRQLLDAGYRVRVLDTLTFGAEPIAELRKNRDFELMPGDMRNIATLTEALAGVDGVVNLAAIVGDPACKQKPEMTIETNYLANKVLAEACKFHQINRFVYASTCSVYGASDGDNELDESCRLNPVSHYARSKILAEEGVLSMVDDNFAPTVLRMGTLYGHSPRMRFDLVVNTMTKNAVTEKKIYVHGGGKQWRPLLHVADAAQAYVRCLEAPIDAVRGAVFNVGSQAQNYQIVDIGRTVARHVPGAKLVLEGQGVDARNYVVSFTKIEKTLGFRVRKALGPSVVEIRRAIEQGKLTDLNHNRYYNSEL